MVAVGVFLTEHAATFERVVKYNGYFRTMAGWAYAAVKVGLCWCFDVKAFLGFEPGFWGEEPA